MKNQQTQKVEKEKSRQLSLKFQFLDLRKMLKLNAPFRSTIKSQKPFFAMKMDYDFAHMEIRAFLKQNKEQISIFTPLGEIPYFQVPRETYEIQIRIIYEGG